MTCEPVASRFPVREASGKHREVLPRIGSLRRAEPEAQPRDLRSAADGAEIADGMIPVFMDPQRFELFEPHPVSPRPAIGGA
jgi:hypothetical protein